MTRSEHLNWAKARALEYLDRGDLANALTSFCSDMNKHDETKQAVADLMPLGMLEVMHNNEHGLRNWINGFN